MTFKNYTPHDIKMNDGTIYSSIGVARVSSEFTEFDNNGICQVKYGEVEGLPDYEEGVMLIVSAMVLAASNRKDLVAPATGHHNCIRDERGHIVSVPGFISH